MQAVFDKEIRYLKGIGPRKADLLKKLGLEVLRDLLLYFPRRLEDRAHFKSIRDLRAGDLVTISAFVKRVDVVKKGRLAIVKVVVGDGTGLLEAIWFNQAYLRDLFKPERHVVLSGKIERFHGLQIRSPEYEFIEEDSDKSVHTGRIVPIYSLTEGITQKMLRRLMFQGVIETPFSVPEYLPEEVLAREDFMQPERAVKDIHFPASFKSHEAARRRIVYEEFLSIQIQVLQRAGEYEKEQNHFRLTAAGATLEAFAAQLPFSMTEDQERALREIARDMAGESPMNRLLQGDVGCGKTLVACAAMLMAVQSGFQAALLIPTEILAEQHLATLSRFLAGFGIRVESLTGSTPKKERERILQEVQAGQVQVFIGTHALLQPDVVIPGLGLLVIDEQHKFGVMQRAAWLSREKRPHLLVMSATPIPRTLGLTLYGDLKITYIRQMPKGRKPIRTYVVAEKKKEDMYGFLKKRVAVGEQVYFLFPLVEETEKSDLKAAVKEFEALSQTVFKGISTGLVHGRMKKQEKDAVMMQFKEGHIKVLFATSVIEVGIDNPNATCMVIEHAERFGLAQLHQLRGRVGRGEQQSFCFLRGYARSDEARERLAIMTRAHDGFTVAEEDLRLRGPGDFGGTRQSGLPLFLLADLIQDQALLEMARADAAAMIARGTAEAIGQRLFFKRQRKPEAAINN